MNKTLFKKRRRREEAQGIHQDLSMKTYVCLGEEIVISNPN